MFLRAFLQEALLRVLGSTSSISAVKSFVFALALCSALLFSQSDARIPLEVRHKSGYVNPTPKPPDFTSAMLWGIAIADTRVTGFGRATVEIRSTELTCRVDGTEFLLNNDAGAVRGGLYRRYPWFGTDVHDPMPVEYSDARQTVVLRVGTRPDRVWHFWASSRRTAIPQGHLEGCTVKVHARISQDALLQVGFDYWRDPEIGYGRGGNNHEAGASNWYFPSPEWQDTTFSDIRK